MTLFLGILSFKGDNYDVQIDNSLFNDLQMNDSQIGTTLTFKGNLRISWSFDIKYNKNIDLIFFPEENPYINYSVLYAKDFSKTIDEEYYGLDSRNLSNINIPYNINYDFVKDVLSKSNFSESQQKRFFDSRFGSVLVPMEIEFEWYAYLGHYNDVPLDFSVISLSKYDKHLFVVGDEVLLCLGIIKSHKILPHNIVLNFPPHIASWEDYDGEIKSLPYSEIFHPLPTSALAITKTNINDFIVNLRDKPDSKEGKIVAQLLSQKLGNRITIQQTYYKKEKSKLINPLSQGDYLVLIWDILPNDWCKIWVLKMPDKNTISSEDNETKFNIEEIGIFDFKRELIPFVDGSYANIFNNSPSNLKLYEGYIHSSGLEYLVSFGENYIKR